ncbi:MAG: FAD-dependent oxidoreductase [Halobacteriales archaeon]|nr:FAD-dependent oxidoreductase [Halobacteriales archaeon]
MEGTEVAVEDVRYVGKDTVAIDLSNPEGWEITPGQFVQVGLSVGDEFVVRHYTVSSPYSDGRFEITVGIDEEGELSPALAGLEPGDYVSIDGPYGRSFYEGEESVVVLAGGPGVGPAVGIGERVADEHGAENASVVYVDDEPAHVERLDALRIRGATVVILDEDEPLDDAVAETVGDEAQVFVYGFESFLEDVKDALDAVGYEGEPKVENFGPEPGSE